MSFFFNEQMTQIISLSAPFFEHRSSETYSLLFEENVADYDIIDEKPLAG